MPRFEWCHTCPECEERVSRIAHLYIDDSASATLRDTLVLALFQTKYVGFWGRQNIEWRVNSGRRPDEFFHFAHISRHERCRRALLGRTIIDGLNRKPGWFTGRGLIAPFTVRDERFKSSVERLRFYLREFITLAARRLEFGAVITVSKGPHEGDKGFMGSLQRHFDELAARHRIPSVTIAAQAMKDCQLLQLADLAAGCTRYFDLRMDGEDPNPNKLALANEFMSKFLGEEYDVRVWNWDAYRDP